MNRLEHDTPQVPARKVLHDFDGDEFNGYDLPRGEVTVRAMTAAEKAANEILVKRRMGYVDLTAKVSTTSAGNAEIDWEDPRP